MRHLCGCSVASLRMDRTAEFRQIIASRHAHQHQRVTGSSGPPRAPAKRSEFAVAALQVGADIHTTAGKLAKLTKLVQSKSLFEDPTIEINQLTDIIKSDINALKGRHGALQGALAHTGSAKQRAMHSKGVVDSLESRLIEAATEFDRVLHTRARNIEHMHTAQDQFTGTFAPPAPIFEMIAPPPAPPSSSFGGGSGAGGAAIGAIGSSTPGAALAGPSTDPTRYQTWLEPDSPGPHVALCGPHLSGCVLTSLGPRVIMFWQTRRGRRSHVGDARRQAHRSSPAERRRLRSSRRSRAGGDRHGRQPWKWPASADGADA